MPDPAQIQLPLSEPAVQLPADVQLRLAAILAELLLEVCADPTSAAEKEPADESQP